MGKPDYFEGLPDGHRFRIIADNDEAVLNYLADLMDPKIMVGIDDLHKRNKPAWVLFYKYWKDRQWKTGLKFILIVYNAPIGLNTGENKYMIFVSSDLRDMVQFFRRWYDSEKDTGDKSDIRLALRDILGLIIYHYDKETVQSDLLD